MPLIVAPIMQRLDPKLDVVFRFMLIREPALLHHMLEGTLGKPIQSLEILDRDIPGELPADKAIELDVRVKLGDGSRADIEMQIRLTAALGSRLVFYAARDYSTQLARGAGYEDLTPTAVVAWLVEPLFPDLHRLHACFELRDRYTHTPFGDELALHVLQLSMIDPSPRPGEDARVHRWARFFMAQSDEELEQLAAEDPIMSLAKETLEALSQDPTVCRLAQEREDALALYRIDLATSKRLGKTEGLREGKAAGKSDLLLKQLGVRFGPPPEATRARLATATPEQLDTWAERVLTATTLDEVLAP
jgi:predicted transposase/invertase (TIGR01784 family)